MTQQTSIESYIELKNSGTLGERQLAVYNSIKKQGDASNLDIAYDLQLPINRITPRTNELVKKGKVCISRKATSGRTGKRVIFWKVV